MYIYISILIYVSNNMSSPNLTMVHGQRSTADYSPWGHKESDMTV